MWENSLATNPFARHLFNGEYDEIYGLQDDKIQRIFAGRGVLEYEEIETAGRPPGGFDVVKKK